MIATSNGMDMSFDVNENDLAPVLVDGSVEFLPVSRRDTPTWLIIVHKRFKRFLTTSDENGDRIAVGGISLAEALGHVMRENPKLKYDHIVEHMEV